MSGGDFGWLGGRASEERPSWGRQRLIAARWATANAAFDIQTSGGKVVVAAEQFPPTIVATESRPPNVALATNLFHPRGVVVVADTDEPPQPFADDAFDLVTSPHPASVWWAANARMLRPGGTYLARHVGRRRCPGGTSSSSVRNSSTDHHRVTPTGRRPTRARPGSRS